VVFDFAASFPFADFLSLRSTSRIAHPEGVWMHCRVNLAPHALCADARLFLPQGLGMWGVRQAEYSVTGTGPWGRSWYAPLDAHNFQAGPTKKQV